MISSKYAYLRERFRDNVNLPGDVNVFERDWLFQILCSALLADAANTSKSIAHVSADLLSDDRIDFTFQAVMNGLFNASPPSALDDERNGEDEDEELSEGDRPQPANSGGGRLQQALSLHVARPEVRSELRALTGEFANVETARFDQWLRRLVLETLGEAILQACIAAAPFTQR